MYCLQQWVSLARKEEEEEHPTILAVSLLKFRFVQKYAALSRGASWKFFPGSRLSHITICPDVVVLVCECWDVLVWAVTQFSISTHLCVIYSVRTGAWFWTKMEWSYFLHWQNVHSEVAELAIFGVKLLKASFISSVLLLMLWPRYLYILSAENENSETLNTQRIRTRRRNLWPPVSPSWQVVSELDVQLVVGKEEVVNQRMRVASQCWKREQIWGICWTKRCQQSGQTQVSIGVAYLTCTVPDNWHR